MSEAKDGNVAKRSSPPVLCCAVTEIEPMRSRFSSILSCGFIILAVIGCSELRKKNAVRESTPDFEITADQLAKEFKEGPFAADMKYTGQTLAITGRVDQTLLGTVIAFTGHEQIGFVTQCNFDKDGADSYKKIKRGDELTVVGVCMGRDTNDGPLIISHCILR